MNKVDYNQPGGFPFSTQILDAAQEAYKTFNAYGNYAGDLAIIAGCEVGGGGNVTSGFVSIYGELLPFQGGQISNNVAIVETADARGFEDGSVKPVIYTRYATFGEATVSYPWVNFRRPLTLFQLEDRLIKVEKSVPLGLVAVWGKFAEDVPEGWLPWDIAAGCVIVGRKAGDPNFGNLGGYVGTAQVQLTNAQIPSKSVSIVVKDPYTGSASSGGFDGGGNTWRDRTISVNVGGLDQSHTNIQPSLIADHMIFVGFD